MKNLLLISILLFFNPSFLLGQTSKQANIWYFGKNAGLDFNSGKPIPLTDGALSISEGCATICNQNGNLLFYTDGRSIWNSRHLVMPNAVNLGGDESASQSGIIVPQPGNPNRYFVFSVDKEGGPLQYAIVDMTLNGGLGGIISKNNSLLVKASEKITAIRHCNNIDFWVVMHEISNNTFKAYLITSNGLSTTFVESKVGSVQGDGPAAIGYMKASNNGRKIAVCSWSTRRVELFNFDNANGILSNVITFQDAATRYAYGAEFSPNNQYLYVSSAESKIIHQFDVNATSDANFASSRIEIGVATNAIGAVRIGALQIAPDNLIYVALDGTKYLGVINKPDLKGTACNYVEQGIYLSNKNSQLGLPNLISSYLKEPLSVTATITKGANCNDITLSAKATSSAPSLVFQWFLDNKQINGANQSSFKPTRSGSYFVSVKEVGQCIIDSAKSALIPIVILDVNPKIVGRACGRVQLQANATSSLLWSGNGIPSIKATQDTLTVSGTGTQIFKVRVTNPTDNTCYLEKEITVDFTSAATYSFGKNNISACDTVTLSSPTNANWNSYVWSLPGGTTVNSTKILVRQSGKYVITVKNTTSNCEAKDTVDVIVGTTPTIKPDEKLCLSPNSITIDAGATGNNLTYEWSPGGARSASLIVNNAGKYQVKVTTAEGCSAIRSIETVQTPLVDLGNDVTVCEGEPIEFKPQITNLTATTTYVWSTGETTPSISPQKSGLYTLSVYQSACQATDSVNVIMNPSPRIKADLTMCLEKTIEAGGLEDNLSYEWQDLGETKPVIEIQNEGIYKVKISNQFGCSKTRTITVDGPCSAQIFAPTAFTPNRNGINDIFKLIVVGGEALKLDIYNRWGNPIYSEESSNPKWDGEYNGDVCPSDIYPYVFYYRTLKSDVVQKYRGTILIYR
jgi:gliding motility-associated-like protein